MEFEYPLTKFDSTQITLNIIKEKEEPRAVKFHIVKDTANIRKYQIRANWEATQKYELLIPAGVFSNVAQEQNDTLKYSYTGSDPDKYAIVKVNVRNGRPRAHYILQLTDKSGKTQKEIFNATNGSYVFEYVSAGEAMLRVVEDINANGKWDTGDMVLMRQPERTEIYKNENDEELFTTKENWEFELDVDMNKLFAPVTMESVVKMLNDREDARLKKLAEEMEKKRIEDAKKKNNQQGSGFGFGGLGGMGGGMNGMGGGMNGMGGSGSGNFAR